MAIENLGMVYASSISASLSKTGGPSVRINDGDAAGWPYIRFRTMQGSDFLASFTVALSWRGVPKATAANGATVYGGWTNVTKTFATSGVSSVSSKSVNGLTEWAISLHDIYNGFVNSSWDIDHRKYDELDVSYTVTASYPGGSSGASAESWVGWIPRYTLSSASYDLKNARVTLTRTASWLRKDDRWAITSATLDGADILNKKNGDVWGTVGSGNLTIPMIAFTRKLKPGALKLGIRVNGSYKSVGSTLTTVSGTATLADRSHCNTPSVTTSASGDTVTVRVTDSGDKGVPITVASVSLRGSGNAFDTVEIPVPGTATFFCLLNGTNYFDVVGSDASDSTDVSSVVTKSQAVSAGKAHDVTIVDLETSEPFDLVYDADLSMTGDVVKTTESLAGREYQSVWYGVGKERSGTIRCSVVGDGAASTARRLMSVRSALLRTPDGYRAAVDVGSVTYTHKPWGATLDIQFTEVS